VKTRTNWLDAAVSRYGARGCAGAGCLVLMAFVLSPTAYAWQPSPSPGLVLHGSRSRRDVALTFDADMTPLMLLLLEEGKVHGWYDRRVTDELRAARAPATVFLTGLWARTYPAVVRRLAADPLFELENHSWDHAAWEQPCYGLAPVQGAARKRAEVTRTVMLLARIATIRPRFFRFPGGCQNEADVRLVESLGEKPVQWDVVSGDAYLRDPRAVEQQVVRQVRPGSIIVMHLIGAPRTPATAQALRMLIPALRARGFRLVTLRALLATP
jgi:peptidoglycan-N-acetylglucosamine deacetylase